MRDLVQIAPSCSELFRGGHLPTQNLLSDAEVTICKYKYLIISEKPLFIGAKSDSEGQ